MSEARFFNLGRNNAGRYLMAALCFTVLFTAGCVKDRPVAVADDVAQRDDRAGATLGEYIRSVFKLSQQAPPEAATKVEKLHQTKPELARLARQIEAEPANIEARRALAAAYLEEGLLTEAHRLLEELRAIGARSAALEMGLAEIWDQWGNFPLAHRHALSAIEIEPDSSAAWKLMGRIQLHRGEFAGSAEAFGKALELGDTEDAYLYANLGYVHFKMGEWNLARPHFERALELDDSLVEVHNNLGITLAQLHEDELALEHFRAVANEHVALNNLGVVQMERGDWLAAHAAFKHALAIEPEYGKAAFNLSEAETFLPAPVVVDVGNFATQAPVTVAVVAAPPREASTVELAALPTSGSLELPAWPRSYAPLNRPAVTVASLRTDDPVHVPAFDSPLTLPIRSNAFSWLATTATPVLAVSRPTEQQVEHTAQGYDPGTVVSEPARTLTDIGFERQLASATARPGNAERVQEAPVDPVASVDEPSAAAQPAAEEPVAMAAVSAPDRQQPVDVVEADSPTQPVADDEQETMAAPIEDSPAPPPATVAVEEKVESEAAPAAGGSSAGRLVALLAIVGLGAAAGSITAGRFWGLVGGLVGALAAAFTTLLRG